MNRPIVTRKMMNTMDVELKSTGPQSLAETQIPDAYSRPYLSGIPHIDALFGELIPGMTIAVGAHPGTGKTTFFLQLSDILAKGHLGQAPLRVCFISGEQDLGMIKKTAQRIGVDAPNIDIMNETDCDRIVKYIKSKEYQMVVIDSLHCVYDSSFTTRMLKKITAKIHAAKASEVIVVMICHSTKAGGIKGGTDVTHTIDCEMYLHHHNKEKHIRKLFTEKNRMGACGSTYLQMTAKGLNLLEPVDPETNMTHREMVSQKLVSHMEGHAALSSSALQKLCRKESFTLDEAMHVLTNLVETDKVIQSDDLWLINELV